MSEQVDIVVAMCRKTFGIGIDGKLPWNIPEDMHTFKDRTYNSVVVMGRQTYCSLPSANRPLKNRINVVITRSPNKYINTNVCLFCNMDDINETIKKARHMCDEMYGKTKCFVIGGEAIYKYFLTKNMVNRVYLTHVNKEFITDRHFYLAGLNNFTIKAHSDLIYVNSEQCNIRYITYERSNDNNIDAIYASLVKDILDRGNIRSDRTGTGTISIFGHQMHFDLRHGLPILTTKYVPWKMVVGELLWFLKGDTNVDTLKQQGINIWNKNTTRQFLDNRNLTTYIEGDIGPMYGFQLRHFGAKYDGCNKDYTGKGIDQLMNVIQLLNNDPFSRRIMMTTHNVSDLDNGCLEPCHGITIQFYVTEKDEKRYLSCHMYQRSADVFLGLPWNITSYAVLTHIIAKKTNLLPLELIISIGDAHLYSNHVEQAIEQLSRTGYPMSILRVSDIIITKNIDDICLDDFDIIGYFCHPQIKAKMSV